MKYCIFIILFIIIPVIGYTAPTEADRETALSLMYELSSDQELHFAETSNYETTNTRWIDGFLLQASAYSTFAGKGYVLTVTKVEYGNAYIIERHFGDDDAIAAHIKTVWTCMNCSKGESFTFDKHPNEHGLVQF